MERKVKLALLFTSFFLTSLVFAEKVEVFEEYEVLGIFEEYECTINNVYDTGSGQSTDRKGGTLKVTIINKDVEIRSSGSELSDGSLKLVVRSDFEIIAVNNSMQFTYKVQANKFNFTTGNGQSKFRSGVGHIGTQRLTYGSCTRA